MVIAPVPYHACKSANRFVPRLYKLFIIGPELFIKSL
jgi:hypothetical protein